jgi:aspartyl-tRNA(Asn)/glutamyl-tRNA(Gln) amidotransferase subunit B
MKQSLKNDLTELKGMIGLEIHTYILTKEKLFCKCLASRERGLKPNTNICPICTGQPGAKPMLPNKIAIGKAIQIGLMLNCKINTFLPWQRKHYSWPDLPKGFQNTLSGKHAISLGVNGRFLGINISSMHLEEDPASWDPETGEVDYNRSGLPLVEIITAPEFTTSEEVTNWLNKLLHSLSYLKAIDPNAGIKVDVNVNIPGKTERVEMKNINSVENIGLAINYELKRHSIEEQRTKETRRFDPKKLITIKMREKEGAEDYRFIADPDLQPIIIGNKMINAIESTLPESPEEKLKKMIKRFKIDEKNASILTKNVDIAIFFERIVEKIDPKFALSWVTIELLRFLNYNKTTIDKVEINPEHFISLLKLVKEGKITELQGKQLLNKFYPKSFNPINIEGKITDKKELEQIANKVIKNNEKAVKDYMAGEQKSLDFLMGEIMKLTNRRADYKITREVLSKLIK